MPGDRLDMCAYEVAQRFLEFILLHPNIPADMAGLPFLPPAPAFDIEDDGAELIPLSISVLNNPLYVLDGISATRTVANM